MPSTFRRDFAEPPKPKGRSAVLGARPRPWQRLRLPPQWRALGLGVLTALASAAFAGFQDDSDLTLRVRQMSLAPGGAAEGHARLPNPLAFTQAGTAEPAPADSPAPEEPWRSYTLEAGETLSQLGKRAGLSAGTALALARSSADVYPARRLRSGHTFRIRPGENGRPAEVRYQIDDHRFLRWQPREGGGFHAEIRDYPRTVQVRQAYGRIETSLFEAGAEAGLSERTTMELARIFGWDIDFAHDLRRGDWFRVLYEEVYREGERVADGAILAAEFITRGKSHRAIRFTDSAGRTDYYHPDGRSVRKAFLRSPVKFTRITSRFSRSRNHPILKRRRAHKGVDYGAPSGTPVRSTGEGRVIFRSRKGGYGRVVMIRHAGRYTTVYAHLSGYARSARRGRRVKQGQTIGYVGQSGLATGPHLHYEFRVHGRHRNPLTVRLPNAEPLPEKYRDTFRRQRHHLTAWLDAVGPEEARLASAGNEDSSG